MREEKQRNETNFNTAKKKCLTFPDSISNLPRHIFKKNKKKKTNSHFVLNSNHLHLMPASRNAATGQMARRRMRAASLLQAPCSCSRPTGATPSITRSTTRTPRNGAAPSPTCALSTTSLGRCATAKRATRREVRQ